MSTLRKVRDAMMLILLLGMVAFAVTISFLKIGEPEKIVIIDEDSVRLIVGKYQPTVSIVSPDKIRIKWSDPVTKKTNSKILNLGKEEALPKDEGLALSKDEEFLKENVMSRLSLTLILFACIVIPSIIIGLIISRFRY